VSGRFITFEGIEGVGKSTQIRRAAQFCQQLKRHVVMTREPGGTPLAEAVRALVLTPQSESLPDVAELLLMASARAIHTANLIQPALSRGDWVLCDRYSDATRAYQGGGRGMNLALIETILQACAIEPDLTFWLDAPVAVAWQRVKARGGPADRFEAEQGEFFERIRAHYERLWQANPTRIHRIDASGSEAAVAEAIQAKLRALL